MSAEMAKITDVRRKFEKDWMNIKGVVAVGTGMTSEGFPGIIVSVKKKNKHIMGQIPGHIDDVIIEIQETGEIKAF